MRVELTNDQAAQLLSVLQQELRELSRLALTTSDARYRAELSLRHGLLDEVVQAIGAAGGPHAGASTELEKEMAHPGD